MIKRRREILSKTRRLAGGKSQFEMMGCFAAIGLVTGELEFRRSYEWKPLCCTAGALGSKLAEETRQGLRREW